MSRRETTGARAAREKEYTEDARRLKEVQERCDVAAFGLKGLRAVVRIGIIVAPVSR